MTLHLFFGIILPLAIGAFGLGYGFGEHQCRKHFERFLDDVVKRLEKIR